MHDQGRCSKIDKIVKNLLQYNRVGLHGIFTFNLDLWAVYMMVQPVVGGVA